MCSVSAVVLLASLLCSFSTSATNQMWEEWRIKHAKSYANQTESAFRRATWEKNLQLVTKHNQEASVGRHNFTLGLNHLSDMTAEEINKKLNGFKMGEHNDFRNHTSKFVSLSSAPVSVDWRKSGLVSPVRDQGLCGSCWAFSSLGALEGQLKKHTGVLVPLSPQNLVDCSTVDGNFGCRGGYITKAYHYIIRNNGVDAESFYPYEHHTRKCRYSAKGKAGHCSNFHILRRGDETALRAAVATVGPIAVAVDASTRTFHSYKQGVYSDFDCNPMFVNHAVLVVGYGTDAGQDYWLVKNSWGTQWGEAGFIRMARNKNNMCGIATFPVYPSL